MPAILRLSLLLLGALFRASAPLRALLSFPLDGGRMRSLTQRSGVRRSWMRVIGVSSNRRLSLPPLRCSLPLPRGERDAEPDTSSLFPCEGRGPSPALSPNGRRRVGTDASPINRGFGLLSPRLMMGHCLRRGARHLLLAKVCTVIGRTGCLAEATPLSHCIRFTPQPKTACKPAGGRRLPPIVCQPQRHAAPPLSRPVGPGQGDWRPCLAAPASKKPARRT